MILLTGATGLLGSCALKRFLEAGVEVTALKRKDNPTPTYQSNKTNVTWLEGDILDVDFLTHSLQGIETVIHAAAMVSFNPRDKELLFKTNVEGTANVVNACLANNVKLIHISSVAALGRQKGVYQIDESATWVDSPLNSTYGKSKYLAELEVYRGIEEGLKATIVCPSFILAGANWQKSSAQLFNYVWKEKKFYSSGLTNYVDVEDVSELIYTIFKRSDLQGQRYIASAGAIAFYDLFEMIAKRFAKQAPSVLINNSLLQVFARLEEVRCLLTGSNPMITRESVKAAGEKFVYSNKKSIAELGIAYQPLEETLNRCCNHYLQVYSINK